MGSRRKEPASAQSISKRSETILERDHSYCYSDTRSANRLNSWPWPAPPILLLVGISLRVAVQCKFDYCVNYNCPINDGDYVVLRLEKLNGERTPSSVQNGAAPGRGAAGAGWVGRTKRGSSELDSFTLPAMTWASSFAPSKAASHALKN